MGRFLKSMTLHQLIYLHACSNVTQTAVKLLHRLKMLFYLVCIGEIKYNWITLWMCRHPPDCASWFSIQDFFFKRSLKLLDASLQCRICCPENTSNILKSLNVHDSPVCWVRIWTHLDLGSSHSKTWPSDKRVRLAGGGSGNQDEGRLDCAELLEATQILLQANLWAQVQTCHVLGPLLAGE